MKRIKKAMLRNICAVLAVVGSVTYILGPVNVEADEYYEIVVDGKSYGSYGTKNEATEAVIEARVKANEKSEDLVLSDFSYEIQQTDKKSRTSQKSTVDELCELMLDNKMKNVVSGYLLKMEGSSIMLENRDAVFSVLDKVVDTQDPYNEFSIVLEDGIEEGQNIVTARISPVTPEIAGDVTALTFAKDIVAVQAYGVSDEIMSVDDAVAQILQENRIGIYVTRKEQYTEEYTLDTQYIEEDDWYASEKEVVQEGSVGIHDVTALVTYINGTETGREITSDTVVSEPVAKIVKVGTKEKPAFIKPLNGGSFSSGFGSRWGRAHEGVDWSCSVGTTVFASCKGTVVYAGWQNGYGNTIIISHGDGLKTRYAHLSSILVSNGQSVEQGTTIGKSGNTGNSTGPHLHFEILLDGEPVNPLNYL